MEVLEMPVYTKEALMLACRKFCRPELTKLLEAIDLDAVYDKTESNYLWKVCDYSLRKVLDREGGPNTNQGTMETKTALLEFEQMLAPFLTQNYGQIGAALLSQKLISYMAEPHVAIIANSGSQALESALCHAKFKFGKEGFLAVKGGFHSKALLAIQRSKPYNAPFSGKGFPVHFLDLDDRSTWMVAESMMDQVSAIIFEPLLTGDGMKELPKDFIAWLYEAKKRNQLSLIADETQLGAHPSGGLLVSKNYGLRPDCTCLSKSIGGGLVKIGALMVDERHYVRDFSIIHTPFNEDDISCFVAMNALEWMEQENFIKAGTAEK